MPLNEETVSRETFERLQLYFALLKKWQKTINLISRSTLEDAWARHFEDLSQIVPLIPDSVRTVYDIGSGGGFPGMVVAIMRPDLDVHFIESDGRKCSFLRTVSRETSVKAEIHTERVEHMTAMLPPPDLITARALAPVAKLMELCAPWVLSGSVGVAPCTVSDVVTGGAADMLLLKGRSAHDEVAEALKFYDFTAESTVSETDSESSVLFLSGISKKSP